jgi:hypothetical protein
VRASRHWRSKRDWAKRLARIRCMLGLGSWSVTILLQPSLWVATQIVRAHPAKGSHSIRKRLLIIPPSNPGNGRANQGLTPAIIVAYQKVHMVSQGSRVPGLNVVFGICTLCVDERSRDHLPIEPETSPCEQERPNNEDNHHGLICSDAH